MTAKLTTFGTIPMHFLIVFSVLIHNTLLIHVEVPYFLSDYQVKIILIRKSCFDIAPH